MTETRHRFVGDPLAYEFEILKDGAAFIPAGATLEAAALGPEGGAIAGSAVWLDAPNAHVVRVTIGANETTKAGTHDLQLRIDAAELAEPVRARVFLHLLPSAI